MSQWRKVKTVNNAKEVDDGKNICYQDRQNRYASCFVLKKPVKRDREGKEKLDMSEEETGSGRRQNENKACKEGEKKQVGQ